LQGVALLALSACDTAVGQPGATGREFESFGVLAQRQGARAVLATLWPVSDLSTASFMARLYREHGRDTAAALRHAPGALHAGQRDWRRRRHLAPSLLLGAVCDHECRGLI